MKWLDSTSKKWLPLADLQNCTELVDAFEKNHGRAIIGIKKNVFDISYAVMFNDGSVDMVSSNEVKMKWPNLLENFLVHRIQFPQNIRINVAHGDIETKALMILELNPPTRIIGDFDYYL